MAQMKAVGFEFKSVQMANQVGHTVCLALAAGVTGDQLTEELASLDNLNQEQAQALVTYAAKDYCPRYADQVAA